MPCQVTKSGDQVITVDLSAAEGAINAKVTKDLLFLVYDDGGGDEVPLGITDPSRGETFSTIFFQRPGL